MKQENYDGRVYEKCYAKRKHLFGIKVAGEKGWYVEPCFEELGTRKYVTDDVPEVWFKQNGRYGLYNVGERRVVLPAVYGFPFDFGSKGEYATVWKDYKAGVIDRQGNEVVPIIYDEIEARTECITIPNEQRREVTLDDGTVIHIDPKYRLEFRGYACFTNDGCSQAYDENCQPCEFCDWEAPRMNRKPEYDNKEAETMTIAELECLIQREYIHLLEMGYQSGNTYHFFDEHRKRMDEQEERVNSLIVDRRTKMDQSWVHNVENAHRVGRTNRLLMRAVEKAVRLGKRASKSLRWMEKVSHTENYDVEVTIHPEWQDSQSDLRYVPKYKSSGKEIDRLDDENCELADTHIWNIIAAMGGGPKREGISLCFSQSTGEYSSDFWDVRELTLDDGQSWDEGIHFPAYQDEYFTHPFHALYLDYFNYSFEDLCNINDFRVNVDVRLETREQEKKEV